MVHGKTQEEHDQRLKRVMEIVKKVGLHLNKEKYKPRMAELTYFDHLIGKDGIKPNPEKTAAIANLSPPADVSELRTMLGMFNYLTKFLPHLSSTTKPITNLLKSDVHWSWGPAQMKSVRRSKTACQSSSHTDIL